MPGYARAKGVCLYKTSHCMDAATKEADNQAAPPRRSPVCIIPAATPKLPWPSIRRRGASCRHPGRAENTHHRLMDYIHISKAVNLNMAQA